MPDYRAALPGIAIAALLAAAPVSAQIPDEFTNLQVLPEDIDRAGLMDVMRGFSFALGVRCQYCHVGGDGVSFAGVEFASDDDPDKRKARYMLEMVETINSTLLAGIPERDTPNLEVSCKSCHRGQPKPVLLTDVLRAALEEGGVEAAVERYRTLREEQGMRGSFDFGEWETNTFAEALAEEGRTRDAIAIYELNFEFYPQSVSIAGSLGQLYERLEDPQAAIEWYEKVLELVPEHRGAKARLEALRGGG